MEPLDFLDAVAGFQRSQSRSSADRAIRLAVVDPAYNPWAAYPDPPAPARVTFEGETTLSTKAYAYANGYIPYAGTRVVLVPIGNTYLITGSLDPQTPQGFWQSDDGLDSGVEFGGGSYYNTDDGMVIAGDLAVSGDLSVTGVGAYLSKIQGGSGPSVANSTSPLQRAASLTLPLSVGTWECHLYGAYTSVGGDIKVAWEFSGTCTGTRHSYGMSPFTINTNTQFATPSRDAAAARNSVHGYTTEVPYGANDSTNQAGFHEHGFLVVTVAGNWTIGYAQYISNGAQAQMQGSTMITARRVV